MLAPVAARPRWAARPIRPARVRKGRRSAAPAGRAARSTRHADDAPSQTPFAARQLTQHLCAGRCAPFCGGPGHRAELCADVYRLWLLAGGRHLVGFFQGAHSFRCRAGVRDRWLGLVCAGFPDHGVPHLVLHEWVVWRSAREAVVETVYCFYQHGSAGGANVACRCHWRVAQAERAHPACGQAPAGNPP